MLDLLARDHDLSAALHTADLEVHADAQDKEAVIAAWMGLFHDQFIVDMYIHKKPPRIELFRYIISYLKPKIK